MYKCVIEKHQSCWTCKAEFMVLLSAQFTEIAVEGDQYRSRFAWLAFAKCCLGTRRLIRRINANHATARRLKGWST